MTQRNKELKQRPQQQQQQEQKQQQQQQQQQQQVADPMLSALEAHGMYGTHKLL